MFPVACVCAQYIYILYHLPRFFTFRIFYEEFFHSFTIHLINGNNVLHQGCVVVDILELVFQKLVCIALLMAAVEHVSLIW